MLPNWSIHETRFDPAQIHKQQTIFSIGNGYLGLRGFFEEGYPNDTPVVLAHGVFDDVPISQSELVNLPNPLDLTLLVNGDAFRLDRGQILYYQRQLNLKTGSLSRNVRWRSSQGNTIELSFERFASLDDPHLILLQATLTSVDFSGKLEMNHLINGRVDNGGYSHWTLVDQAAGVEEGAYLHLRTRSSGIEALLAFCLSVRGGQEARFSPLDLAWTPGVAVSVSIQPGQSIHVERRIVVATSLDRPAGELRPKALSLLSQIKSQPVASLVEKNLQAWEADWEACNVTIEGDDAADQAVRYNIFQLLIAAPRWSEKASIGARGLTGLRFHGHTFCDTEAFCLPFFIYTRPHLARNLLLYRYHTLPGARKKARQNGYLGSMYAWESAATGEETTPRWMPTSEVNLELERIWCGDIQQHVTANVSFAVYQYWQASGDDRFMRHYGAEILLDTAKFWASRVEWNPTRRLYEINNVIGPDEYHLHVDNNAYTNYLVIWNLERAIAVYEWLEKTDAKQANGLKRKLGLGMNFIEVWRQIADRLVIPREPEGKRIEQFEGFFDLEELRLRDYDPRYQSIQEILGVQRTRTFQVIRQPDVLGLIYFFLNRFDLETITANWQYYAPRTDLDHGSAIGHAIHSAITARLKQVEMAYQHFCVATQIDTQNIRGNTGEGIHIANCGAIWQAVILGFAGLAPTETGVETHANLPKHWSRLSFSVMRNGERIGITINNDAKASQPQDIPLPALPAEREFLFSELSLNSLIKSQQSFQVLLQNQPGMTYRAQLNRKRTIESVNEACYNVTGYLPSELIKDHKVAYGDLIHPADREYVWSEILGAIQNRQPFWILYRIQTARKEEKWVWEQGMGAGLSPAGEVVEGVIVSLKDFRNSNQTLLRISERLETLHTVDHTILEGRDPGEVASTALKQIRRLIPFDFGCLAIPRGDSSGLWEIHPVEGKIWQIRQNQIGPQALDSGEKGRASQSRLILRKNAPDLWIWEIASHGGRAQQEEAILTPLISNREFLGALLLFTRTGSSFQTIDLDICQEIASSLAIYRRQSRLIQELQLAGAR